MRGRIEIKKGYKALIEDAQAQITSYAPAEASKLSRQDGVTLVDLRDPREVEREGRIPGAKHCPRGMLEFWIDPESPYHKPYFSSGKAFIFYCASGWRSALATKTAQDMGLAPVAHIEGGFTAWMADGLPVEPGKERAA